MQKQTILNFIKRILKYSIGSILIFTLGAAVFTWLKPGPLLKRILNTNYFIATLIILYGIVTFFAPVNIRKIKGVVDHSNIAEVVHEHKEKRVSGAYESIAWGICNILLVSLLEFLILRGILLFR